MRLHPVLVRILCCLALLGARSTLTAAQSTGTDSTWREVGRILQTPPVATGGYTRFNFPRRDITLRMGDVTVSPAIALGGWAGFSGTPTGAMMMGDLIVTCWSTSGRNRRCGELVAQGATPAEAAREIGMVVEGLTTAPVLRDLAHRLEVEMPITEGVCAVLDGIPLSEIVGRLMEREPTVE